MEGECAARNAPCLCPRCFNPSAEVGLYELTARSQLPCAGRRIWASWENEIRKQRPWETEAKRRRVALCGFKRQLNRPS